MPDLARVQVREDDVENTWNDVGHKAGNTTMPIQVIEGNVNNWEKDGTNMYVGFENKDGVWEVMLVDKVAKTVSYATVVNNTSILTYTDAWTNRATLTYENYSKSL